MKKFLKKFHQFNEGIIIKKVYQDIPNHIAIIMDGNGRWASQKNKNRIFGHKKGVQAVRKITEHCIKLGVKYLTLYTFSNENWNRPKTEVIALMKLLVTSLDEQLDLLLDNNVKLNVLGNIKKLDVFTRRKLKSVIDKTDNHTGLNLNLAISYGSRQEIVEGINNILKNDEIKKINENDFNSYLYTANIKDPDLLIRTGKEYRISNFLLWQIAYTEIYFSKVFWPDFDESELDRAIKDYKQRDRRFGKIK